MARSGKAEIGEMLQLGPGVTRIVNRMPVFEGGALVGAVGQVGFSGILGAQPHAAAPEPAARRGAAL